MYCIPLFLVTGKHPVKSVYVFPVTRFASTIATNTKLLFYSILVKKNISNSIDNCSLFVDVMFFLFDPNDPKQSFLILVGVQKLIIQ